MCRPGRPTTSISILSPRAGRDIPPLQTPSAKTYFNPLSPCGERPDRERQSGALNYFNPLSPCGERLGNCTCSVHSKTFQSSLPVRGETSATFPTAAAQHFNPLSPCGERHAVLVHLPAVSDISIHSPRAGRDSKTKQIIVYYLLQLCKKSTITLRNLAHISCR